ncbi:MAG TPA: heme ABC exporter ATP-binding protein CcmA [Gemmatimonadales bacterium]|jgi:heme exporter protein A|nr:heme ABC exporter ATP-binding protein CcmA [Gemmatimonadales bacterium]
MTSPRPATPAARFPLLEAIGLERRFGAARVLRGVSLVVRPGECHLVVGPNGAGKSTLLRLLAGLARPTAGTVAIEGAPLAGSPSRRRLIGLLSHQSHLYDDLSPAENLRFAARLYGLSDPGAAARERLAAVGLADRADDPVRRLSRGMVQRAAIARALLHSPRLLLLDEPYTGLDPHGSDQVTGLLRTELAAGRALVLVSHDVQESWDLASHAHALVRGSWAFTGPRGPSLDGLLRSYREVLHG